MIAERQPTPLWLVPAVMLVAAIGPWPYGYYVLLRVVVCLASAAIAWRLKGPGSTLMWAFIALAILYNPVVKIPLKRDVWMVVNIISMAPFLYLGLWQGRRR